MAKKIPQIRQKRSFFGTLREMIGRREETGGWGSVVKAIWNMYSTKTTVDYSRVNYTLARAIYYASEMEDRKSSKKYGGQFLLGSVFGKPIVNAATSFIAGSPIQVKMDDDETQRIVNEWLRDNHSYIQLAIRNSLREADAYVILDNNAKPRLLSPDYTDKITNPINSSDVLGYNTDHFVQEDPKKPDKTKYTVKYRKEGITVIKTDKNNTETTVPDKGETFDSDQPIPVVHFANEPEPGAIYGNSEYQSCYTLMANYHAVLESGIQGNIYNSTPVPYATGIENMQEFIEKNGVRNADGEYEIKWEGKRMMLGGANTKYDMLQAQDMTAGASTLLNLIFWGICQTSETPEFIMGTAVQSSKASTETQLPVMLAKADRKRGVFTPVVNELVELVIYTLNKLDTKVKKEIPFSIVWPPMIDQDMELNIKRVESALGAGLITRKTAAKMLAIDEYVDDLDLELKDAEEESNAKMDKEAALYPATPPVNNAVVSKVTKVQEMIEDLATDVKDEKETRRKTKKVRDALNELEV